MSSPRLAHITQEIHVRDRDVSEMRLVTARSTLLRGHACTVDSVRFFSLEPSFCLFQVEDAHAHHVMVKMHHLQNSIRINPIRAISIACKAPS